MRIRRIVVAIDASPTSLAALEATTELAARWDAELLGIFVEDANLLRMASLPFAREVGSHSGAFRAVDPADIKRQFRSQADRARSALEKTAQRLSVRASFEVARGSVKDELLGVLREGDLLSLGKGGQSLAARLGLGSTARAIATAAQGCVLMHSHVARVNGPVTVIYDGHPAADRALATAVELVRGHEARLIIMCIAATREATQELARTASARVKGEGIEARCRHLTAADAPELVQLARFFGTNTIVLPANSPTLGEQVVEAVARDFAGPVLVVAG